MLLVSSVSAQRSTTTIAPEVAAVITQLRSSSDPKLFSQAYDLGRRLIQSSRFNDAAALFAVLVDKQPQVFPVLYSAALATFNAGDAESAESFARRAVKAANADVGPESKANAADSLVLLAVILAVRKNDTEAVNASQEAVHIAPKSFDAQFVYGRALFSVGDYSGAVRAFDQAVKLKPSETDAQFFLATALEKNGDDDAALIAYRKLATQMPNRMEGHLGLGVLLVKKGGASMEEGMKELRAALQINPQMYEARVNLGRALVLTNRPSDAIEHLKVAAELAPNNPEPHYQLSLAYRRLGRNEEAAAESAIVKRIHDARRGAGSKTPQNANN